MTITYLVIALLWALAVFGWFLNLFNVVGAFTVSEPFTTLFIGQIIGLFFAPLGVVLGWVV